MDFIRTNHARVAEPFGVKAWRVEDPAQDRARRRPAPRPALLDMVSQELPDTAVPVSQWMG